MGKQLTIRIAMGVWCACIMETEHNAPTDAEPLISVVEALRPLHRKLGKSGPDDWLARHHEPGQTFREYYESAPVTPQGERSVIYLQPLGEFTATQRKIITITADFMSRFYNRPVRIQEDIPLSTIPKNARRRHPEWAMKQVLTTYILDHVLRPRLPADAAASIAFTTSDLWPGRGWNFVFGQASLRQRVGVWSIYRNGDPNAGEDGFRRCLMRTLKTAVHELGHMFSMQHCTKYECCMCGSNHREESDRRPLWFCPECMAKVCWATRSDPVARYRSLAEFCGDHALKNEKNYYEKSIKVLIERRFSSMEEPPAESDATFPGTSFSEGAPHLR